MGNGYYNSAPKSGYNNNNKQMSYQNLKKLLASKSSNLNSTASGIRSYYSKSSYGEICEEPRPLSGDTIYRFDLDDKQLEEYLAFAIQTNSVPDVSLFEFNIREEQLKKIINTFLNFEIQTPEIVGIVLSLLRRYFTQYMDIDFLKETLERISLFPTSERELEDIKCNGYSDRQRNYFSFFKFESNALGAKTDLIKKEIVFSTFINKAKELAAEEMIGKNWFRFFEAFYSKYIDQEIFDEYKDQLTSTFILRHPQFYKELELNKEIKEILKQRLIGLINEELGTYGYPEGVISVKIKIHNDEINLFQAIDDDDEQTLCIQNGGDELCEERDDEWLLNEVKGEEDKDDSETSK